MEHINDMLWRVLFKERNVDLCMMTFNDLHHIIFPCINMFDGFLHADTTEKMVASAKEISSNILFSTCVSPSPTVYQGLINAESNYPATDKSEFVSQDHVVHSVNVYLLGIFLFFNHQLLHDRVYESFKRDLCEVDENVEKMATMQFIDSWKVFAFCHDIGYPFEKLTNLDGDVRQQAKEMFEFYRNFGIELKYDRIMRSTAILMFTTIICDRSQRTLQDLLQKCKIEWRNYSWIGVESEKLNKSGFPQSGWADYYRLYSIYSNDDLNCLYPFITKEDIVIVVRNSEDTIVGLQFDNSIGLTTLMLNNGLEIKHFASDVSSGFTCEFYCKNPNKVLQGSSIKYNMVRFSSAERWIQVATSFCEPEISIMENNKMDCRNTVHRIYSKLRECLDSQDASSNYDVVRERHLGSQPKMTKIVLDSLKEVLQGIKESKTDYEANFDAIGDTIRQSLEDEEFFNRTIREISSKLNPAQERQYTVWNILHSTFTQNWDGRKSTEIPTLFSAEVIGDQYICACRPLEYCGSKSAAFVNMHERLIESLKSYLGDLGILPSGKDMTFFTRYTHKKTKFDHGIMGTHILLYTAALQEYFTNSRGFKICSLNSSRQLKAPNPDKAIIESLGAILVHNIYTGRYKEMTGISYLLTLDEHPLAYFGAFCDALQIWDRHHSVDQSRRILTNFNPSRSHVALEVHGKNIVLTCETDNSRKTGDNQRDNLEQFLKCGASLLKVNFIEEPI